MSSNYQVYQDAARLVRSGWTRHRYTDRRGNVCMVQAVLAAAGIDGLTLPESMAIEIDSELSQYPAYRKFREARQITARLSLQSVIIAWNDMPWRRQGTVAKVLEDLANRIMQAEIERLQQEVERLNEQIRKLEAENSSLRHRLANILMLRSDRAELQQLSDELERTWQELAAVNA